MDQLKNLWKDLSIVQRVSILVAVLVAGGGIAALLHFRHEEDFRPLYTGMAPEDAAPVVQKLKEAGVEYRLSGGGSIVSVPSARLADSRLTLAAAGLPKSGRIGFELFDKTNFGATELVEHVNLQRALEGELERSVMSMSEVVQARVHLTFPRESVFLDQQQPAKASVMVRLKPGAKISPQKIAAVSNLVASAVEGLNIESVAVIDMDGKLLSRPRKVSEDDVQLDAEALEVRQRIERDLVNKINATLEPLLGADQFRSGASVDCDLTSGDQQEETFNPDQSVMLTSQKSQDTSDRATPGGVPGTASNLPHPPALAGTGVNSSHISESTTYQSSRVVRHTRIPQGVIRRMSLSVLVGQPVHWEGSGKGRKRVLTPPSPETLKTIREVVAGVTGFNNDRGDQLIVESLPFESSMAADPLAGLGAPEAPATALETFIRNKPLMYLTIGGLVVVMVLAGLFLRSRSRRAPQQGAVEQVNSELKAAEEKKSLAAQEAAEAAASFEATQAAQLEVEAHGEMAERVRQLAQRDPLISANVLRMWLHNQKA